MKAFLIGGPNRLIRQDAVVKGAEKLGYEVITVPGNRAPAHTEDAEFAICSGMRNETKPGREACLKRGIPLLIVELGYLRRANNNQDLKGYFQLGWNRIGWVPEGPMPADRWRALDIPIASRTPGQRVLVAGQVGFDAQHNLSSHELCEWLRKEKDKFCRSRPWDFRPHPLQASMVPAWADGHVQKPAVVNVVKALQQAALLITFNSTLGVDAMLWGVPVISHPSAHYHAHAVADVEVREAYLRRLAYAQWTLDELGSGEALEFVLKHRPGAKEI